MNTFGTTILQLNLDIMTQHVFIIGAKSLGAYGGYETFVSKLVELHKNNSEIKYHIACKANGEGSRNEKEFSNVKILSKNEFELNKVHCFKIVTPKIGPAAAIYYDVTALKYCVKYIKENNINNPIIYILASRIGPFMPYFYKKIHSLGGRVFLNPDGHEWMRAKWSYIVRKYWKISEKLMVKYSDLVICDSLHIEEYIHEMYDNVWKNKKSIKSTFIAYGSDTRNSMLNDNSQQFLEWLRLYNLDFNKYYLVVGRFVPENNYETMIREFMRSSVKKDLVVITNVNDKFYNSLEKKIHFKSDPRIKFVGTVYDQELLKKIRENAYAYLHGHEVGGTNPSLLEALSYTKINLLLDVGFNKEVAKNGALYWTKASGSLANLLDNTENLNQEDIEHLSKEARNRILSEYSWDLIGRKYLNVFVN